MSDNNFAVSMFLYPDNNEEKAIKYWQKITGLPRKIFKKSQFDKHLDKKSKMRKKLPYGTLQIRIRSNGDTNNGVKLFRRIKGWTKGALEQV